MKCTRVVLREVYSNKRLHQKDKRSQRNHPNFTPNELEKRTKPNVRRRKEIIKVRAKINQIENRKTNKKSTILSCFLKR